MVIWTLGPRNIERAVKVFSAVQIACVVALLVWALTAAPLDKLFAVSSNISSAAVAAVGQLCSARNASSEGADAAPLPQVQAVAAAAVTVSAVSVVAGPAPPLSPKLGLAQAYRMSKGVTAIVSGWSTMALNIADLSRYARSQRSQVVGQALGFVVPNVLAPLVGAFATCASIITYGATAQDWSVVELFGEWPPALGLVAALLLALSLLSCNLLANVVSPANDIANVCPARISFRAGALATLLLSACTCPWLVFSSATSFVVDFLIGYSSITGALLGVMLADYFLVRRQVLTLRELYDTRDRGCRTCACGGGGGCVGGRAAVSGRAVGSGVTATAAVTGTTTAAAATTTTTTATTTTTVPLLRGRDRADKVMMLTATAVGDGGNCDDDRAEGGGRGGGDDGDGHDTGHATFGEHHVRACGVNWVAVAAVLVPLLVVGPGFLHQLAPPSGNSSATTTTTHKNGWSAAAAPPPETPTTCPDAWDVLYGVSWFVTLGLSVALYTGGSFLVRRVRARAHARRQKHAAETETATAAW